MTILSKWWYAIVNWWYRIKPNPFKEEFDKLNRELNVG